MFHVASVNIGKAINKTLTSGANPHKEKLMLSAFHKGTTTTTTVITVIIYIYFKYFI